MRPIGFSTGAVAYANFQSALALLAQTDTNAVELSALRPDELRPLVEASASLRLERYLHVSVHLPSAFSPEIEATVCALAQRLPQEWPLIVHPDAIRDWELWRELGERVCIENMDKRKPVGQTRNHLLRVFEQLPEASLCFDIGHAHQIDPTMCEAVMILREFGDKLREIHVSEVNSDSKHDPISLEAEMSFEIAARLIPANIPAILESRVALPGEVLGDVVQKRVEHEVCLVKSLLRGPVEIAAD
jgi:sugar phosphate isomerase/epimerase